MRNLYMFMSLSLDGYFEGPDHDLSWHRVDDEFNRQAVEQLRNTDLLLYGRRIYQLMESFWPGVETDPATSGDDLEIARSINRTPKILFSRTLSSVQETEIWKNVKLVHQVDPAEIRRLKGLPGKDICVGGSDLALAFVKEGLIDEFRFMINPTMVGRGTPILHGTQGKLNLDLVKTTAFASGNVLHTYRPVEGTTSPGGPSLA